MVADQKPAPDIDAMIARFRLASTILAEAEKYQQQGNIEKVYQKIGESRKALIGEIA